MPWEAELEEEELRLVSAEGGAGAVRVNLAVATLTGGEAGGLRGGKCRFISQQIQ